jgi:hypothetical protein
MFGTIRLQSQLSTGSASTSNVHAPDLHPQLLELLDPLPVPGIEEELHG